MAHAVGIFEALAQHHVAAALAVHRPRRGKPRKPVAKTPRSSERAGMKLGIAAGQPADVAVRGRRLVGERRERDDLGARAAPAVDDMRIDEGEGRDRRRARSVALAAAARGHARGRRRSSSGAAAARIASRSRWRSAMSARRSSRAARSACSPACTRPRWRSGIASVAIARHRADHRLFPMRPSHRRRAPRWRSLPTRLSTTPAMRTAGS